MDMEKATEIERQMRAMRGHQVERGFLENLFSDDGMMEYAEETENAELFCKFLDEVGTMFDYYLGNGSPRAAINLNDIFTYEPFLVLATRFAEEGKEGLKKIVSAALRSMTFLEYAENADKAKPELELEDMDRHMPIIREWIGYLDEKEVIKAVTHEMASNMEMLSMNQEEGHDKGVEYLKPLMKKQLEFLEDVLGDLDENGFSDLFRDMADSLGSLEGVELLGYDWEGKRLEDVKKENIEKEKAIYMMIGLPASGKSTVYKREFKPIPVVSRDMFKGSEAKERKELERLLEEGKDVVVDDTNYNKKMRAKIFKIAEKCNARVVGVYVATGKKTALERNEGRENRVPPEAIHKIAKNFEEPEKEEGFSELRYVFE